MLHHGKNDYDSYITYITSYKDKYIITSSKNGSILFYVNKLSFQFHFKVNQSDQETILTKSRITLPKLACYQFSRKRFVVKSLRWFGEEWDLNMGYNEEGDSW